LTVNLKLGHSTGCQNSVHSTLNFMKYDARVNYCIIPYLVTEVLQIHLLRVFTLIYVTKVAIDQCLSRSRCTMYYVLRASERACLSADPPTVSTKYILSPKA